MMQSVRTWLTVFIIGVVFYFVDSYLVGFAASIAFPSWYSGFAARYSQLSLAIWDTVTIVPVTVAVSVAAGAVLAKLLERRFFFSGLAAISVAMLLAIALASPGSDDLLATIRNHALPAGWFQVPVFLALWLSLPLAAHYFGRRTGSA